MQLIYLKPREVITVTARRLLAYLVPLLCSPIAAYGASDFLDKTLPQRCGIKESRNNSGDIVILSRSSTRTSIVEKTIDKLANVHMVRGFSYQQPRIEFKNNNKFGISALGIGVTNGAMKDCSANPNEYKSTYLCKSMLPGVGVGSGETGALDCEPRLREDKWSGYCIIGFAPDFNAVGGGLAEAMDKLKLCD